MYVKKNRTNQRQIKFLCLEDWVPDNHLLRNIDRAIDFSFIYEEVKGLYSEIEWGKLGIAPVSLFKIVFIQYLFGIRSMRQTIKEIETIGLSAVAKSYIYASLLCLNTYSITPCLGIFQTLL